ncbi:MAG TPA: VOC family protein [Solirubrobacteraceae bacterium]|nr:VOC family protein [Solirubrobacteraceae bacterium]
MQSTTTCPISRVRLVSVAVRDPDAAISFWRDKVGFEVHADVPYAEGDRWIEITPPGAQTGFTLIGPANQNWSEPEEWSPALLACDDIEASVAELTARGVEFTGPVMRLEDGVPPMAFFLDQDGRRFLLTQRSD